MTEPTKPNENEEQRSAPEQTPPMQPIVDMGAVTTRTARGTVYCLTVVGQIEGHSLLSNTVKTTKYEHVLPLLAALDESEEIDGVLFLLNTCGGDVEAGLAIAELIAGMRKPTVSLVLGGGHSIGVPLAVAPKRSLIAPSASSPHPVQRRSRGGNARHRKNEAKRRPTGVFFTLCSSFALEKRGGKWYST